MLTISNMTGKLAKFKAINTNTLSNPYCQKMSACGSPDIICTKCYSWEMLETFRQSCIQAWERNSDALSKGLIPTHLLPTFLEAFVRFQGHGELINLTHLENLNNIALHNAHTKFALWTKRKGFIRKFYSEHDKPDNLILIYSNPRIDAVMDTPPQFFDRTFNNVSPDSETVQNCTGQKCKDCLLCYIPNNGVTQIVEAVK